MTDTQTKESSADLGDAAGKAGGIWTELGPTLAFIVIYNVMLRFPDGGGLFTKSTALYWATGILIIATLGVVIMKLVRGEKIPPFLIISSLLIGSFGTVGILLQSKLFLFIKPTIINLLYAGVIFGGLAVGRNIWKMLFNSLFDLPDFAWKTLAIRWGLYFIAMAIWNEVLWRNFSEATWANWKLGNLVLGFLFALANTPYTLKHLRNTEEEQDTF
ncbi:MAG: septation protein A [Alphaproteobacteria bacterium]|nr:intracellular septation protein A [Hyphomonas sp.]MBR9808226.1 septation protein A [Alphaproteobacteria bacterium]|tara:strand:- start:475 stop:1122 length:648 start_codon:yes stop_codon:yes gene_type:complete